MELPVLSIEFDDGTSYQVEARPRDLLAVEKDGIDLATKPIYGMYAVAYAGLRRMKRTGAIPAEAVLPTTVDELTEIADVQTADGATPSEPVVELVTTDGRTAEGKDS
jgi:hypothetical protein